MIRLIIGVVLLTIFCAVYVEAGEKPVFQTTKEEIVRELTRPVLRTRGFIPEGQKRSIVIYKKKNTKTIEKIVVISDTDNTPSVRAR